MSLFRFLRPKKAESTSPELAALRQSLKAANEAWEAGDVDGTANRLEATLASASSIGPDADETCCHACSRFSVVKARLGRLDQAETMLDSAIEIITRRNWQNTFLHFSVMNNTGSLRWAQGQRDTALKVFEHAYAMAVPRARRSTDQSTVATILDNLISSHAEIGEIAKSREWFTIAQTYCHQFGRGFPRAWCQLFRSSLLSCLFPDTTVLVSILISNADKFAAVVPFEHPSTAFVFAELGNGLLKIGRREDAAIAFTKAAAQREGVGAGAKYQLANGLGMLALGNKEYAKAESYFNELLTLVKNADVEKVSRALALNNLAVAVREQGRLSEAEPLLREAVEVFEATLGPNHFHPANAMKNLGQLRQQLGELHDAAELYQQALSRFALANPSGGPVAAKMEETRKLLAEIQSD